MKNFCIGDKLEIQCYKHDKKIHRAWSEAIVLDVKKDYMVFGNNRTLVTEAEGTTWKTKDPAIMYYFKDKWYNIIAQMKKDGIYYYCNIATPFIIEAFAATPSSFVSNTAPMFSSSRFITIALASPISSNSLAIAL